MKYEKKCIVCGEGFLTNISTKKYCCWGCAKKSEYSTNKIQIKTVKMCKTCGKEILTNIKTQVFCSPECSRKPRERLNLHLSIIREYFLEKANFCCEKCLKNTYLQLHHIIPIYKDGNDDEDNIIALCPDCHKKEHKIIGA